MTLKGEKNKNKNSNIIAELDYKNKQYRHAKRQIKKREKIYQWYFYFSSRGRDRTAWWRWTRRGSGRDGSAVITQPGEKKQLCYRCWLNSKTYQSVDLYQRARETIAPPTFPPSRFTKPWFPNSQVKIYLDTVGDSNRYSKRYPCPYPFSDLAFPAGELYWRLLRLLL